MELLTRERVIGFAIVALGGCQLVEPLTTSDATTDASVVSDVTEVTDVTDAGHPTLPCGDATCILVNATTCCKIGATLDCRTQATCNSAGGIQFNCANQADCTLGVCCVRGIPDSGAATECQPPNYDSSTGCPAGQDRACDPALGNTECLGGGTCDASSLIPGYYDCH